MLGDIIPHIFSGAREGIVLLTLKAPMLCSQEGVASDRCLKAKQEVSILMFVSGSDRKSC